MLSESTLRTLSACISCSLEFLGLIFLSLAMGIDVWTVVDVDGGLTESLVLYRSSEFRVESTLTTEGAKSTSDLTAMHRLLSMSPYTGSFAGSLVGSIGQSLGRSGASVLNTVDYTVAYGDCTEATELCETLDEAGADARGLCSAAVALQTICLVVMLIAAMRRKVRAQVCGMVLHVILACVAFASGIVWLQDGQQSISAAVPIPGVGDSYYTEFGDATIVPGPSVIFAFIAAALSVVLLPCLSMHLYYIRPRRYTQLSDPVAVPVHTPVATSPQVAHMYPTQSGIYAAPYAPYVDPKHQEQQQQQHHYQLQQQQQQQQQQQVQQQQPNYPHHAPQYAPQQAYPYPVYYQQQTQQNQYSPYPVYSALHDSNLYQQPQSPSAPPPQ
eukprot:TRINITY_DN1499_c0_g1_i1.p1 TRINITY_DN1499_c0_g1~~TRINITY_DN1499_c0_g1_i1.p1  ORF type:complete len:385 (+),score=84.64 TRINITY_DN1499_c0_g1_i1:77-1231(+)